MIRVLVTGFEEFGFEPINPSRLLAARLDGQVLGKAQVYGFVFPVSYNRVKRIIKYVLDTFDPSIVLSFGLSTQRPIVSIEKIALNYASSRIPDNDNVILDSVKIVENGPLALESSIDPNEVKEVFLNNGVPALVSYHAGTFLCNYIFYLMLYYSMKSRRRVGFIHIPYTHENVVYMFRKRKPRIAPSIDGEKLLQAVKKLIIHLVEEE